MKNLDIKPIKIAFVGSPNSGKTTVAQNFSSVLRYKTGQKVELITEYARTFVSTFGIANVFDQYLICHHQLDLEKQFGLCDYLVSDSPAFLSLIYSNLAMDWNDAKQKHFLAEQTNALFDNFHDYHYLFYLPPNTKNMEDGKRVHIKSEAIQQIDTMILSLMKLYNIDFIEVNGTMEKIVEKCLDMVLKNNSKS